MSDSNDAGASKASRWLLVFVTAVAFVLMGVPYVGIVLKPVEYFATCLHETGHAMAALVTGGHVDSMTIVSNGIDAAGVTVTHGGSALAIFPAGYLGATLCGCILLWLANDKSRSKNTLIGVGIVVASSSLLLMSQGLFSPDDFRASAQSMGIGIAMATALIIAGWKCSPAVAQFVLMFLSVQTALNALTDIKVLIKFSLGMYSTAPMSDAVNMQNLTGIPASVWSISWGIIALLMLAFTVRYAYFGKTVSHTNTGES